MSVLCSQVVSAAPKLPREDAVLLSHYFVLGSIIFTEKTHLTLLLRSAKGEDIKSIYDLDNRLNYVSATTSSKTSTFTLYERIVNYYQDVKL